MRCHRIFSAQPIEFHEGKAEHVLDTRAAHYLRTVLRQKAGAPLSLFDGRGGEYLCELSHLDRKQATVKVLQFLPDDRASSLELSLAIGISRGDRMDYALQKSTELGVHSIQPLASQRSDTKIAPARQQKRQAHWQGILTSACEQSGLNRLPLLEPITTVSEWAKRIAQEPGERILLHPVGRQLSAQNLASLATGNKKIAIAVGAEGGFTDEEVTVLEAAGFQSVALGPRTMRTETAPVAMLSILQFLGGDLGGGGSGAERLDPGGLS